MGWPVGPTGNSEALQNDVVPGEPWTVRDVEILAREYFDVLQSELAGQSVNKNDALRRAQAAMPTDRTIHTLKDRCYRISEELWKRDLPFVAGWRPPQLVGQNPNSGNVSTTIWAAVEPFTHSMAALGTQPITEVRANSAGQEHLSDAERRQAVEDLAQQRLMDHFAQLGWEVEDTHLTSPFDARATKGTEVQYLEAKGSTSGGDNVFVTHGEVEWARSHPGQCVMGIVSGIRFDESTGKIDASSGSMRLIDWVPEDGALTPIQYRWTPPS